MRYFILILLILFTGCATQKRCLVKFPPVLGSDTVYILGEIIYEAAIVEAPIAGDTAYVESAWSDDIIWTGLPEGITPPVVTVEHRVKPIRAEVPLAWSIAWVENNSLKMQLIQKDSVLLFKLDSVKQKYMETVIVEHTIEYQIPVVPKKYKFFKTAFWFSLVLILFLAGLLIVFFKLK